MKHLKLAAGLDLPLAAVTEKIAWLGRTGSGKTYGAMKLAELMLAAGAQVGAIDPVGVWRALRVPAEKEGTSFDVVVFGGLYGDLPLEPTSGELVADLVTDRGLSFVLDVSQMIPSEQQRLVRAFADRFFHRKKSAPSAVHLFMEECQEFIPENPSGAEAMTLGVMQRLWKLGRNFGIGGSLISQRPQEIAKKALNMSGTLFAFQMTGPQERKAVRAWVADHGVATDIEAVLQRLRTGEPHVESPTFLEVSKTVQILPRVTADLSSTPKVGVSTSARRPLTPIDVEQLKSSMAATIEKAKADDPKALRARIAELERVAQKKAADVIPAREVSTAGYKKPVEILTDADRELLRSVREKLADVQKTVDAGAEQAFRSLDNRITATLQAFSESTMVDVEKLHEKGRERFAALLEGKRFSALVEKLERVSAPPRSTNERQALTSMPAAHRADPRMLGLDGKTGSGHLPPGGDAPRPLPPPPGAAAAAFHLPGPEQKILNAVAELEVLGLHPADKIQVGLLAGYTNIRSGGFSEPLGRLMAVGYLVSPRAGKVAITDVGRSAAVTGAAPTTPEEMQARVLAKLTGPEQKLLGALLRHYPAAVSKEALGAECHYTNIRSGGFSEPLGRLNTLGIVRTPARGTVVAAPFLFLEGGQAP